MSNESGDSQKLGRRRSDFLNDDSNVYDNSEDDANWHNRTAVRSSTSMPMIRTSSRPTLNPNSTVNTSQLSENWFDNLTQSTISSQIAKQMRNEANRFLQEPKDSDRKSESKQMRDKLKAAKKDSHGKALNIGIDQAKSKNDDSRTFSQPGPKFTKRNNNNTSGTGKAQRGDTTDNHHSSNRSPLNPIALPVQSAADLSKLSSTTRKRSNSPAHHSTNSSKANKQRRQKSGGGSGISKSNSLLGKRKSGGKKDAGVKQKKFARDKNSSLSTSQSSKDKSSAHHNDTPPILKIINDELLMESSSEEELFTRPERRRQKALGESCKSPKSTSRITQDDNNPMVPAGFRKDGRKLRVESDEESEHNLSIFWHSNSKNDKSTSGESIGQSSNVDNVLGTFDFESQRLESFQIEVQLSSVGLSDDEEIYTPTANSISQRKNNENEQSIRSKESTSAGNNQVKNNLTRSNTNKYRRRARLFGLKSTSKEENPFDLALHRENSAAIEKPKEKAIEDTPRLSQRSPTATIKRVHRLKTRLFEKSQARGDDDSSENAVNADNVPDNRPSLSQKSPNKSTNKRISTIREAPAQKSLSLNKSKLSRPAQFEKRRQMGSSQPVGQLQALGDQRCCETSSDETQFAVSPRHVSTPLDPLVITTAGPSKPAKPSPLPILHCDGLNDDVFENEEAPYGRNFLNVASQEKNHHLQTRTKSTDEVETPIDWDKVKEHTDAVKVQVEAHELLAEKARRKLELKEKRIEAGVRRLQSRKEAARKRKNKKPVHEAFMIDGVLYKPPKLPRPKPWATDKLYKYLWKCMKPKHGDRTRVRSARFVLKLSEFAGWVVKRKTFESYSAKLDEFMVDMAKLGIIETRYDFSRFAAEFMPYNFRFKVTPMALPGNTRNIPFDKSLLFVPLVNEVEVTRDSESDES